jgi:hypothetical protein
MQHSDVTPAVEPAIAKDQAAEPHPNSPQQRAVRLRDTNWRPVYINAVMFIVVVVLLGWVNIVAMWIVERVTGVEINYDDLIADGSLFFYSVTLLGGSLYSMFVMRHKAFPIETGFVLVLALFVIVFFGAAGLTFINDYLYIQHHESWKPPMDMLVSWERVAALAAMAAAFFSNLVVDVCENQKTYKGGERQIQDGLY